jgi:hypothetical protein
MASGEEIGLLRPTWRQSEGGVLLPESLPRSVGEIAGLTLPRSSLTIRNDPPRALEQLQTFIIEEEVGFTRMGLAEVREHSRELPFEPAVAALSDLLEHVEATGWQRSQADLARAFYGPDVGDRFSKILANAPTRRAFAPQALHVLLKILVEEAADVAMTAPWTPENHARLARLVLGVHSVIESGLDAAAPDGAAQLLSYFVQAGAYAPREQQLVRIARAMELHRLASEDAELEAVPEHCPVEQWLLEGYGLGFDEQFRVGFALAAMGHAWTPGGSHRISAQRVEDLLLKAGLADRRSEVLDALSTDRAGFAARQASGSDGALLWDLVGFKERPFLRLATGDLLLLSSAWILSWLSEGFHYRVLREAQRLDSQLPTEVERARRPNGQRYTQYSGRVFETYCLRLAESAHAIPSELVLGASVFDEQSYGNGQLTSDIAIDVPPDLVLIEINAGRLSASGLVNGDVDKVRRDLDRVVLKKVNQIGNCIRHLLPGTPPAATIPGVDITTVRSIWPVVVINTALVQTPLLWNYIRDKRDREKTDVMFEDARVRPLTLLDAEDFEQLLGMVEAGSSLPQLLARKIESGYGERDLAIWLINDRRAPSMHVRAQAVEAIYERGMDAMQSQIDFTAGIQEEDSRASDEGAGTRT